METRLLTYDDGPEWWRLRREALHGDPEAFGASAEDHEKLTMEDVKSRIGSMEQDSFIEGAFDEEKLVGMVGFYRDKGLKNCHKGHIWGVYVTPSWRGRGLARQLMEKVLKRAAAIAGVDQILVSVVSTQETAAKLYRSMGFELFGREPRALKVNGRYIDEEHMVMLLNAPGGK